MSSNTRVILSILISFFIAFAILLLVLDSFEPSKKEFSLENLSSKKKIFILGSSQVGQLDTDFINDLIITHDSTYVVYNLAMGADNPTKRLGQLEKIISAKPALIVYGVGFRDFGTSEINRNQQYQLPNTQQFFHEMFELENLTPYNFKNFENPKLATLSIIRNSFDNVKECTLCDNTHTPFYTHEFNLFKIIRNQNELEKEFLKDGAGIIGFDNDAKNLINFKKIISELKNNNIDIIIFAVPSSRVFLDPIPNSEIEELHIVMSDLAKDFDIEFDDFTEKYADLPIWSDHAHVALSPQTRIYSEDVAKIIIKEIEN